MVFNAFSQDTVEDVMLLCAIRHRQKKRKATLIMLHALEEGKEQQKRRKPTLPRTRSMMGIQEADLPEFRRHFRMSRLLFERLYGKVFISACLCSLLSSA